MPCQLWLADKSLTTVLTLIRLDATMSIGVADELVLVWVGFITDGALELVAPVSGHVEGADLTQPESLATDVTLVGLFSCMQVLVVTPFFPPVEDLGAV